MASLESLKQDKADAQRELRNYEKRLKEVTRIRSDLLSVADDYPDEINRKIENALSNLVNGAGADRPEFRTTIFSLKDARLGADTNLNECKDSLDAEIRRIDNKIDALNREIRSLNSKISDAKSES